MKFDVCGQTAAWFFDPFWSLDKIESYSRIISSQAKAHYPNCTGSAMIGYYNRPDTMGPAKTGQRVADELAAIFAGGCTHVQVCSINHVIDNAPIAAAFQAAFTDSPPSPVVP